MRPKTLELLKYSIYFTLANGWALVILCRNASEKARFRQQVVVLEVVVDRIAPDPCTVRDKHHRYDRSAAWVYLVVRSCAYRHDYFAGI